MKLIERKNCHEVWSQEETCGHCKSVLLVEEGDVVVNAWISGGPWSERITWQFKFVCPVCFAEPTLKVEPPFRIAEPLRVAFPGANALRQQLERLHNRYR